LKLTAAAAESFLTHAKVNIIAAAPLLFHNKNQHK
jgi:hypothetical protein